MREVSYAQTTPAKGGVAHKAIAALMAFVLALGLTPIAPANQAWAATVQSFTVIQQDGYINKTVDAGETTVIGCQVNYAYKDSWSYALNEDDIKAITFKWYKKSTSGGTDELVDTQQGVPVENTTMGGYVKPVSQYTVPATATATAGSTVKYYCVATWHPDGYDEASDTTTDYTITVNGSGSSDTGDTEYTLTGVSDPAGAVEVTFQAKSGGDLTKAKEGESVIVKVATSNKETYPLGKVKVSTSNGDTVEDVSEDQDVSGETDTGAVKYFEFKMPGKNVSVTAKFPSSAKYKITPDLGEGVTDLSFKVNGVESDEAAEDDQVTLWPQLAPGYDDGYYGEKYVVTVTKTGDSTTTVDDVHFETAGNLYRWAFTMPAYPVTVTISAPELPEQALVVEADDADVKFEAPEKVKLGKPFTIKITTARKAFDEVSIGDYYYKADDFNCTLSNHDRVVTLTPPYDYEDSMGESTITVEVKFKDIEDIVIDVPTGKTLAYDGTAQVGVEAGEGYTVPDNIAQTDAGTYTTTVTVEEGYYFPDNKTTADVSWTIARAKIATAPAAVAGLKFKKKTTQTGVTFAANAGYTVSGTTSAVNAGSYTATFTPDKNHAWADGTTAAKTVSWSIAKANNKVKVAKNKVAGNFKAKKIKKKAVTIALPKATATSGKATWAVKTADKKKVLSLKAGKVVVKKGAKKGTYTMKLVASVAKSTNYKAAESSAVTVTVKVK